MGHNGAVDPWTAVGLGLDYGKVGLSRTTEEWLVAGIALRDRVADHARYRRPCRADRLLLGPAVSSPNRSSISRSALTADDDLPLVTATLEAAGWIYRGDAGAAGGHVFVLETRPWHRIAHLHAVEMNSEQWSNYLSFQSLLRSSPEARDRYETAKLRLAEQHTDDREAYTEGKTEVVTSLLAGTGCAVSQHRISRTNPEIRCLHCSADHGIVTPVMVTGLCNV